MIDKSWYIIIFMYIMSFSLLGVQYTLGDLLEVNLVTFTDVYNPITGVTTPAGTELKPLFQGFSDYTTLNQVATRVTSGDSYQPSDNSFFDKVLTYGTAAAFIAWDGILLLTGTQIFYMLFLFGVPYIFVSGIVFVYVFFLIRTAIALIRGV